MAAGVSLHFDFVLFFLFMQRDDDDDVDDGENEEEQEEDKTIKDQQQVAAVAEAAPTVMKGQVYVNISPPTVGRCAVGEGTSSGSWPRSRSYDRHLDKSPSPRLGSLERMLSCPVRLSEGATQAPPPPPRVTSFAEIARSKLRNGGLLSSLSLKAAAAAAASAAAADPFSSTFSTQSHSSADFSPILEQHVEVESHSVAATPFIRCYSQGSIERHRDGESRAKAEGTQPLITNISHHSLTTVLSQDAG